MWYLLSYMQKHTPSKLSELESLSQLEDDLKKAKEQLTSSNTLKRQAQQEAEETKQHLLATSARLEETQQQLLELSKSEDSRVKELWKISQERDRVWQTELEAIQKHHSMDSVALSSALNEIQKLKKQLEMAAEVEDTQRKRAESAYNEIENLREEISETSLMVENMRKELSECKGSEALALEVAREAQGQLEEAMNSAESLRIEGVKAKEVYNSLVSDLEKSRSEVTSLENLVRKLKEDLEIRSRNLLHLDEKNEKVEIRGEMDSLKLEIGELKNALEASELRYQEEYIQNTMKIRNAYDELERAKLESSSREVEFEEELKKAKGTIEELELEMVTKEKILKNMSENNKELTTKIEEIETTQKKFDLEEEVKKLKEDLEGIKRALMDKETQFETTREENERLKEEIYKREKEGTRANEEADKSSQRVDRVSEQLDLAQRENTELEAQLRRLKVQSDQWRKAAEAAANMLSNGGNDKLVDRTISLDSGYNNNTLGLKLESPLSENLDDELTKKKNGNVLKKIGVLWKKGGLK